MADEMRPGQPEHSSGGSPVLSGSSGQGTRDHQLSGTRTDRGEQGNSEGDGAMEQAKSAASEVTDRARDMADSGRESAAGALDRAASSLNDRASGDGMPAMAAGKAAEGMEAAAGYMKERDAAEMWDDLERYIREHPMQAVAAAVATGIVVGRVLR